MAVTVVNIAEKAAVSVGTVSRVLNHQPNINATLKQRVLGAMEDLNYTPRRLARGTKGGSGKKRTGQIALLLINLSDRVMHTAYMMQYIHGVQQEIAAAGKKCLFVTWNDQADNDEIPHILLDGEIDGIVFKGKPDSETARRWLSRYPRVAINHLYAPPDCDCVMVDYERGTYDSVKYLASRGHRRIALVDKPCYYTKPMGYRHAVSELGLDVDEGLIQIRDISLPPKSESELNSAIDSLWSLSNPPTAIISNDYFCSAIYHALANRGLNVPNDVSIIGYDNDTSHCEALRPKLTSMDIAAVELGKTAIRQLIERIKNPNGRLQKSYIQGKIVERESVKDKTTGNRQ